MKPKHLSDAELIEAIEQLLHSGGSASEEEIKENALAYIKGQKHLLPARFFVRQNLDKKAFFMAGGPGAGKSETAVNIGRVERVDIIGTDALRKICPFYSGANSNLFQGAASKGVSYLLDFAFKNKVSFILDGNFSDYRLQKENVTRAISRGYNIEILFVHRDKQVARDYTLARERIEGRVVHEDVFEAKLKGAIKTTMRILDEFPDIAFRFFDLESRQILRGEKAIQKLHCLSEQQPVPERRVWPEGDNQ